MNCRYVYDESASLPSPLTTAVGSVGGNPSASRSGNPISSMDDFQMPTAHGSFLSHSEYGIPLIHDIDGPPRNTQAHPYPSSPLASPQVPADRTKPHTRLGPNRQRYPGSLRGGSIDSEKLDCVAGSTNKMNGSPVRALVPNVCGDLFDSQNSLTNIHIDMAVCGVFMNSVRRLPGFGAIQDSVDATKRASLPKATDSLLPIVGTTPAAKNRSDRRRLQDSSNRTVSNTEPTAGLQKLSTSATCTAQLASGAVATGRIKVPSSAVTLSPPSAEFTIFFDSPLIKDRGGAARSPGRQNQLSSQALASPSSFNPPRGAEGKAEKAGGWTTTNVGVEDGPDRSGSHRSTFGGVWSSGERSDMSPSPHRQSSTRSLHMRSASSNLNCSGSGTSGLSPIPQRRAASEPSPMVFHEGHHLSLRRTVQPSMQPVSQVHTSSGVHEAGSTDGSVYNNRGKEEVDGSPLAHQPVYDLSCVTGSLEDAAELGERVLLNLVEPPSPALSSRRTKKKPPKNSAALPKATPPALTLLHAPPMLSKRLLTLRQVRTNTSAMMESGHLKLSLDGGAGAKRSNEEAASESSASGSTTPSYLADLNTPFSPTCPLTTRAPRSPLQNARNEKALGAVVPGETPRLSTSRVLSPSPTLRMSNSVQPMYAAVLSGEPQKPRRRPHSRVRICTGTQEIDDNPVTSKAPWPLPKPPSSIVVKRRLFDPKRPRLRGPRTRELPDGKRQANWTAPETHYTTTLADLAAYDEDEDDMPQWHLTDALWSDEVIRTDVAVSRQSEVRDSRPSSSLTPAVESGVVGAMVLNQSPASTPTVPHMSSLQSATFSTLPEAPAVAAANMTIPGGLQLARLASLTAAASRDAHASAVQDLQSTSLKIGRRTGGIVVDEVDKVLRLRGESELAQVPGELQSEPSSRPFHGSGAPTPTSSATSPRLGTSTHRRHAKSENQLNSYFMTGIEPSVTDSYGLPTCPRSPMLPSFAPITGRRFIGGAAVMASGKVGSSKGFRSIGISTPFEGRSPEWGTYELHRLHSNRKATIAERAAELSKLFGKCPQYDERAPEPISASRSRPSSECRMRSVLLRQKPKATFYLLETVARSRGTKNVSGAH
ncbi:hypothetical protein CGC20_3090 [Leishmania donovani]|uniref:Uncharacterized protein n=1 Tax=Leishmania donovani TaxID=5661 RepID=A0A504X095_LEIDO|nr:hypothetical protein CGC20_3090 [Leishmania donovani]